MTCYLKFCIRCNERMVPKFGNVGEKATQVLYTCECGHSCTSFKKSEEVN